MGDTLRAGGDVGCFYRCMTEAVRPVRRGLQRGHDCMGAAVGCNGEALDISRQANCRMPTCD